MGTPEVVRLRLTPAKAWSLVIALLAAVVAVGLPPLVGTAHATGNAGDVKIASHGAPPGNSNDPHVTCPIDLIWSGYNTTDAHPFTVSFSAHSPDTSGTIKVVSATPGTITGPNTATGTFGPGVGDHVATYAFDLSKVANAGGPNGEFHVDININTKLNSSQSDLKQKTIWLQPCRTAINFTKTWKDLAGNVIAPPASNVVTATYGATHVNEGGTLNVPYGASYTVSESVTGYHEVTPSTTPGGTGTFTNTSLVGYTHNVTNQENSPTTYTVDAVKTWQNAAGVGIPAPTPNKVVDVHCGSQTVHEGDPAITVVAGTLCYVDEPNLILGYQNVSGLVAAPGQPLNGNTTFTVVNRQATVQVDATKTWQDITGAATAAPAGVGQVVTVDCGGGNVVQEGDPAMTVPYGSNCTVADASPTGWHNVSGEVPAPGQSVTADTTFAVVNQQNAVSVDATKTWKDAAGNVVAAPTATKVVTVDCGGGNTVQEGDPAITVAYGTVCTATESGVPLGWHYVSGAVPAPGQAVTANTTFALVNQQNAPRTATVSATKTWKDVNGNVVAAPTATKVVDLTCGGNTIHEGDPAMTIVVGTTCTVTEPGLAAAAPGWHNVSGLVTVAQAVNTNTVFAVVNQQDPANNPPPVLTPNLGLVKAVDAGNNAIVQPGQQLTYALTYSNTGNGAASGVSVTDVLPANATFVSVADGGSYDAGTKTATWTIGNVPAGGTGTVHWTVAVAQNLPAGSAVTNVAMIGSTPSNTVTNPVANGDLTLGKAVDKSSAEFGDTLTYTLTAAATGVLNQTGVVVSDVLPAGTTYVAGSATCASPCTASYDAANRRVVFNVGNLAAGASLPVSFQVTVDRPTPNADGSIPAVLITNVGQVLATGLVDPVMSNEVDTTITAVLGVKITRPVVKPPVVQPEPVVQPSTLPFTGAAFPVTLFVQVGAGLALVGVLMLLLSRRRDSGRHMA